MNLWPPRRPAGRRDPDPSSHRPEPAPEGATHGPRPRRVAHPGGPIQGDHRPDGGGVEAGQAGHRHAAEVARPMSWSSCSTTSASAPRTSSAGQCPCPRYARWQSRACATTSSTRPRSARPRAPRSSPGATTIARTSGPSPRSPWATPATTASSRGPRPPSPRSSRAMATTRAGSARTTSRRCGRPALRDLSTAGLRGSASSASTASWAGRRHSGSPPSSTRRRRSTRTSARMATTSLRIWPTRPSPG